MCKEGRLDVGIGGGVSMCSCSSVVVLSWAWSWVWPVSTWSLGSSISGLSGDGGSGVKEKP